jgi:hypothetical protein
MDIDSPHVRLVEEAWTWAGLPEPMTFSGFARKQ